MKCLYIVCPNGWPCDKLPTCSACNFNFTPRLEYWISPGTLSTDVSVLENERVDGWMDEWMDAWDTI